MTWIETMKLPWYKTMVSGMVAGAASVFGNTPVDVVKTKMQVSRTLSTTKHTHTHTYTFIHTHLHTKHIRAHIHSQVTFVHEKGLDAAQYKSTMDCAMTIAREEGFKG